MCYWISVFVTEVILLLLKFSWNFGQNTEIFLNFSAVSAQKYWNLCKFMQKLYWNYLLLKWVSRGWQPCLLLFKENDRNIWVESRNCGCLSYLQVTRQPQFRDLIHIESALYCSPFNSAGIQHSARGMHQHCAGHAYRDPLCKRGSTGQPAAKDHRGGLPLWPATRHSLPVCWTVLSSRNGRYIDTDIPGMTEIITFDRIRHLVAIICDYYPGTCMFLLSHCNRIWWLYRSTLVEAGS